MLFRPSFCAHCGERIERTEWTLWTSRRFCQVCESEFKGQDLIPRAIVALGIVIGIFGVGSYLRSSPGPAESAPIRRQATRLMERQQDMRSTASVEPQIVAFETEKPVTTEAKNTATIHPRETSELNKPAPKPAVVQSGYFCGAETRKGTPCSRRVKGNVRCFQHTGMAAMISSEKLRIN